MRIKKIFLKDKLKKLSYELVPNLVKAQMENFKNVVATIDKKLLEKSVVDKRLHLSFFKLIN